MTICQRFITTVLAVVVALGGSNCVSQVHAQQPEPDALTSDEQTRLGQLTTQLLAGGPSQMTAENLVDYHFLNQKRRRASKLDDFSAELLRWWAEDHQLESSAAIDALGRVAQLRHAAAAAGFNVQLQDVFALPEGGTMQRHGYDPPSFVPTGARMLTRYLRFGHPRLGPIEKNGFTRLSNGAIDVLPPRRP